MTKHTNERPAGAILQRFLATTGSGLRRSSVGPFFLSALLAGFALVTLAQEVSIPDPGLNAAIRETLQKPSGPLTEQDLLSLTNMNACCREVRSVQGLEAAKNLLALDLQANQLASFVFPSNLVQLKYLNLSANPLTNVFLPDGLTNLAALLIESTSLARLALPTGLTGLEFLQLDANQFTNLTLPADLRKLSVLGLGANKLTSLILPGGLTNLQVLTLQLNQLTTLTLPPDLTRLTSLLLGQNPIASLVLSEPAAAGLTNLVESLRAGGIPVFTYPEATQLIRARSLIGAFQFAINGPPGVYRVLASTNLVDWSELGTANNQLGKIVVTDSTAHFSPQKFYRVRPQ